MRRILSMLIMLLLVVACKDKSLDKQASNCTPSTVDVSRGEMISDVPVTVVQVGSNPNRFELARAGSSASLGACNLAVAYQQDGLQLFVSGYFLTWPELKYINISPLPFEVTEAKKR